MRGLALVLFAGCVGDGSRDTVPWPGEGETSAETGEQSQTSGISGPTPPGDASSGTPPVTTDDPGPGTGTDTGADTSGSNDDGGSTGEPPETPEGWPPYPASSFWNTPIPDDAAVHPSSATMLGRIDGVLSSDVTQNSYPVYVVDGSTPLANVNVSNYFSYFENFGANPDGDRVGAGFAPTIPDVPVPNGTMNGGGSDAQVLFWDPETGAEWAFWQFYDNSATNGYLYDALLGSGRTEGSGRGAGVTKLGGLVSAEEAEVFGHVAHAVAFAYQLPTAQWVYPATKSDGGSGGTDIPEGARIQLDPSLTKADFDALGLTPAARAIAVALQTYGLILVDGSGRPKAFFESNVTGDWSDAAGMEYALAPLTEPDWAARFRVIDWNDWTGGPTGVLGP